MTTVNRPQYRFEFAPEEVQEIIACNQAHGFAIIKGMLPQAMVEMLKAEVRRVLKPLADEAGAPTYAHLQFVEASPVFASLMQHEPFIQIARALCDGEPMTLNRSAAIYKQPGAGPMGWHTDWVQLVHPYGANAVLNNSGASSMWFYLNGIDAVRGGLAIIPGSHTDDWPAPEGFAFTERRQSFYPLGGEPAPHMTMDDVPGAMPVIAEPGDLIVFAEKTYHGVYPHQGTEVRLSCGISFRKQSYEAEPLWPLPESAAAFIDSSPPEIRPLVAGYWGIDVGWQSNVGKP